LSLTRTRHKPLVFRHAPFPCPPGDKDAPEKTVTIKSDPLKQLDSALQGALGELLSGGDFEAKPGTASKAIRVGGAGPKYVAMLGLGKAEDLAKEAKWGASPYQVCCFCAATTLLNWCGAGMLARHLRMPIEAQLLLHVETEVQCRQHTEL
jgi:hypothetical protein